MVRVKRRYILLKFYWERENKILVTDIKSALISSLSLCFGQFGLLCSNLLDIKYLCEYNILCILKIPRSHYYQVRAALFSMDKILNKPITVQILKASGTIIKAQKNAIEYLNNNKNSILDHKRLINLAN